MKIQFNWVQWLPLFYWNDIRLNTENSVMYHVYKFGPIQIKYIIDHNHEVE